MIIDFPGDAYSRHVRTTVRWLLSRKPEYLNKAFRTAQNRYVAQLVNGGVQPTEARERAQKFARDVVAEFASGQAIRTHRPLCEVVSIATRRCRGSNKQTAIGGGAT